MKSIGFIDFYISEWHANNYPAWIKEASQELGCDYEVKYAWAQQYVSPVDGRNTDEWCEQMGITRCETVGELCEKSDVLLVLSPSNPEKHIELARMALPYGKPTYIDKPFADTVEDAKEIFALAKKYGTPFFSSSALRYATELDEVGTCVAMTTIGGGGTAEEYIIHQVEMIVKKLGIGAAAVKAQKITDDQHTFTIKYEDSRRAGMHFVKGGIPFAVTMNQGDGSDAVCKVIESDIFKGLIKDILTFFETGKRSFDSAETLEVNKILVSAIKAKACPDEWIEIERG